MHLTPVQDQAIAARMALIVGATTFDRLFASVRFDEVDARAQISRFNGACPPSPVAANNTLCGVQPRAGDIRLTDRSPGINLGA